MRCASWPKMPPPDAPTAGDAVEALDSARVAYGLAISG